jgi:hypothetical protein
MGPAGHVAGDLHDVRYQCPTVGNLREQPGRPDTPHRVRGWVVSTGRGYYALSPTARQFLDSLPKGHRWRRPTAS